MPENMTKKRKAAAARKARRRRRQRRQLMLTSLFLLVCVGAFASLSLLNRRAPDRAEAVEDRRGQGLVIVRRELIAQCDQLGERGPRALTQWRGQPYSGPAPCRCRSGLRSR